MELEPSDEWFWDYSDTQDADATMDYRKGSGNPHAQQPRHPHARHIEEGQDAESVSKKIKSSVLLDS